MISSSDLVHIAIEEIWNRGEIQLADALFSPDYINHGGMIPDMIRGPEAVKLSVALYRSAFPNFEIAMDDLTTDEGAVVVRWVAHRAPPLMDKPASKLGSLRGITRCRLQDGKIAESWTVWDSRAALARCVALKRTLTRHLGTDVKGRESRIRKQNGS
jgi:predicted SnoaL-like aldol condensation-catalyzing enzyme